MATQLLSTFRLNLPDGFHGELSLHDLTMLGLSLVVSAAEYLTPDRLAFSVNPALISVLYQAQSDRSVLESYFERLLTASGDDPDVVIEGMRDAKKALQNPGTLRQLQKDALAAVLPPARQGRPAKLSQADWPDLLRNSERLLPLSEALLKLRTISKGRPAREMLAFLRPDFTTEIDSLSEYLAEIEKILGDDKLLSASKTMETRSRKLAESLAGLKFNVTPLYAITQANQARRHFQKTASRSVAASQLRKGNS